MKTFQNIFAGFAAGFAVTVMCVYGFSFLDLAVILLAAALPVVTAAVDKYNAQFETEE